MVADWPASCPSRCLGPAAADAGRHENRAGQDDRRFLQTKRGIVRRLVDAFEQRVKRHGLQDEPRIVARVVDLVRIPLAEVIVGPLVGGMIEIVSPWIERQLCGR